jgi:hypothetical protein
MTRDTLHHPELQALLAENRRQDVRFAVADWLRDRDESEAADRVLACPTPEAVDLLVAASRAREAGLAMATALVPAVKMVAECGVQMADLLRPAVAALGEYAQQVARTLAAADPPAKPKGKGRRGAAVRT